MNKIEYLKMFELEDSHFWFLGKRFFVDAVLNPYKKSVRRILDLGSGTGGLTKHLENYGKVMGVENYYYAVKLSRKRKLNVVKGDINNLKIGGKFDLITVFDVFYHKEIESEEVILDKIYSLLNKNGLILITDSALNLLKSEHDLAVQGKRRYTISDFEKLLKTHNFKILKKSYLYFSTFPFLLIKRFILSRFSKSVKSDVGEVNPLINKILIFILKIESRLLHFMSFPIGSSVIILARKK
jgi:SAM-dependent methyltransferase